MTALARVAAAGVPVLALQLAPESVVVVAAGGPAIVAVAAAVGVAVGLVAAAVVLSEEKPSRRRR